MHILSVDKLPIDLTRYLFNQINSIDGTLTKFNAFLICIHVLHINIGDVSC